MNADVQAKSDYLIRFPNNSNPNNFWSRLSVDNGRITSLSLTQNSYGTFNIYKGSKGDITNIKTVIQDLRFSIDALEEFLDEEIVPLLQEEQEEEESGPAD